MDYVASRGGLLEMHCQVFLIYPTMLLSLSVILQYDVEFAIYLFENVLSLNYKASYIGCIILE